MDSFQQMKTSDIHFLLGNTDQAWLLVLGTRCMLFAPETWQILSSGLTIAPAHELTKDQRNPCIKGVLSGVPCK